jgi:hypothetical protein
MIEPILAAVLPVLLTAGLGYVWVRLGKKFGAETMTPLISTLGTPVLVFSILMKTRLPPDAFIAVGGAAVAAIAGFVVFGSLILRLLGLRLRTYLPCLAFPNAGNLGLPLALYAYGEQGLSYAIIVFSMTTIANFTLGQGLAAGRANWLMVVKSPIPIAAVLGLIASYLQLTPPIWLANTLSLIGGMTIPLMLLMLGASLAQIRVATLPRAFAVSLLRIGGGAAIGLGACALFGLTGTARSVIILQCAMPVAVYNYLFAQMWNNQPEEVASLVVVSTLLSVGTIPMILAALMS